MHHRVGNIPRIIRGSHQKDRVANGKNYCIIYSSSMNTPTLDKISPETYLENLLQQCQGNSSVIESDYLQTLQKNAFSQVKELTLPNRQDEEWRFTDLSALYNTPFQLAQPFTINPENLPSFSVNEAQNSRIVFVNGIYSPQLSDLSALPKGIFVGNLARHQYLRAECNCALLAIQYYR